MKKIISVGVIVLAGVLAPQILPAQGTTYLSNLDQVSAGSFAVGSDSWLAASFRTGTNADGYVLDSVLLGMTDATDNPSGFMAMLYSMAPTSGFPNDNLGILDGSLNPETGGIYTFTSISNLMLSPDTYYFIVVTAGTTVVDGAYESSYTSALSHNPNGGWGVGISFTSSDGSSWAASAPGYPQFAINATPIPEPGVLSLLGLGSLGFLWHRRKAKAV